MDFTLAAIPPFLVSGEAAFYPECSFIEWETYLFYGADNFFSYSTGKANYWRDSITHAFKMEILS